MSSVKLASLLIVGSLISVVASTVAKKAMSSGDAVENDLQTTAQRINREGPRLIGNDVRLDGAAAGPGRVITYLHTNVVAAITDIDLLAFKTHHTVGIRAQVCSTLRGLLQKDVTMVYQYRDKNGAQIGSISVDKSHCK